jgi:hypothetical protein
MADRLMANKKCPYCQCIRYGGLVVTMLLLIGYGLLKAQGQL